MGYKILIVDDNPDVVLFLEIFLARLNYSCEIAKNGKEALEKLTQSETLPKLILLDHNMPVMDGPTFVSELKQKHEKIFRAVPIVLTTARDACDLLHIEVSEISSKIICPTQLQKLLNKYCPYETK